MISQILLPEKTTPNQSDNKNFQQCAESEQQELDQFPNYEEHIPVTNEKKKKSMIF